LFVNRAAKLFIRAAENLFFWAATFVNWAANLDSSFIFWAAVLFFFGQLNS
jgi:hypothetical protein